MPVWTRVGFIVAGLGLLIPDQLAAGTDLAGAILGGALLAYEFMMRQKRVVGAAAASDN
jgi:hypothetical protein